MQQLKQNVRDILLITKSEFAVTEHQVSVFCLNLIIG